tara:strand:- start:1656 stop:3047 length:1392 start_codon:yes stop_codon:yes gene_type:complete
MNYRPLFGYTPSVGNLDAGPPDLVGPAPFEFLQYENIWTAIAQDFYSEFSTLLSAVWIDIDSGTKERIAAVLNQMVFTEDAKVEEINGILSSWGATNVTQEVPQDGGGDPIVLDTTIPDDFQNNALSTVWIELETPSYGITALTYDILPAEVKSTVLSYAQEYLNTSDKTYLTNIVSILLGEWDEFNPDSLIVDEDDFADVDGSWGNLFGEFGESIEEGIDEFTDWAGDIVSGETTISDIFTNVNAALNATIGANFQNSEFANIVLGTVTQLAKDFPALTAEQIAQSINFFKLADFPKYDVNELVASLYTTAAGAANELGAELSSVLTDPQGLCSAENGRFVREKFGDEAGDNFDRFCGLAPDAKEDVVAISGGSLANILGIPDFTVNDLMTAIVNFNWTTEVPTGSTPAQIQDAYQGSISDSIAQAGEARQTSNLTNNIIGGVAIGLTAIGLMQLVKKVRGS